MKRYLDIENWNRKQHFEHFKQLKSPYFGLTANVDVTVLKNYAKNSKKSFFSLYLLACLRTVNAIENFKYRIENGKIAIYDEIHVSATIARADTTYGFTFIHFNEEYDVFHQSILKEKERVQNSSDLFPPINQPNAVYCSAIPWVSFTAQEGPTVGVADESIPKFTFGKIFEDHNLLKMPVSIHVNHALMDGYHVGLFFKKFQIELDKIR